MCYGESSDIPGLCLVLRGGERFASGVETAGRGGEAGQ